MTDDSQLPSDSPVRSKECSADALKCESCGARSGDRSKVDADMTVTVRIFHGKHLCSDCEDALCYSLEN